MADLLTRLRVRVPAGRAALPGGASISAIQFRGIGAAKDAPAADDDDMADDDTETEAARAESGDDDVKKSRKSKKAKKARGSKDDGDPDRTVDPDNDGDDDEDEAGDDDDDGEDMKAGSSARSARMRERGRIAAILESPGAAANLAFAVQLALTTDLPRSQAVALLKNAPKANGGGLHDRMAALQTARPGAGAAPVPKGQAAIDNLWDQRAVAAGIMPARR